MRILTLAMLPLRAIRSLPHLVGFLLVGWLYLREMKRTRARRRGCPLTPALSMNESELRYAC